MWSRKARRLIGRQWVEAIIDWVGQFKALKRDGYRYAVSLETHWNGGGSPEEMFAPELGGNEEASARGGCVVRSHFSRKSAREMGHPNTKVDDSI